ncbi:MAG TPA: class I SAM-dependent methyltransferase [Baekduia sp.]|jgi:SAM-dependent methyltransferase|nr:class I SAM-dependent methyltransferase [Baekduia sp.]
MPDLADNISMWNEAYDWSQRGDEWSDAWGGVSHQWWVTLFSRIQGFVPAGRILEIAPGYGRWTHYLRDLCDELVAVDIAETAVAHCRERFAGDGHVSFHVNDGTSLAIAEDRSVDLIFSFDSLVHAEQDVIAGYLTEFSRVLAADGVAFIHHSNIGSYEPGAYDPHNIHWRATTVSAELVERLARAAGLRCVSQETVAWGNDTILNDCFSVITRAGSRWDRENDVAANMDFSRHEIAASHRISTLYPRARPSLAFRAQERPTTDGTHVAALELAAAGDAAAARSLLHDAVRRQLDPEALNDLAVLAHRCGDDEAALALLEALVRLHPEHTGGQENLAGLLEARA